MYWQKLKAQVLLLEHRNSVRKYLGQFCLDWNQTAMLLVWKHQLVYGMNQAVFVY